MDLIEVFKTGTHTDSAGRTREWTDKDLAEIASSYNPAINEAPIVIGHPEHDSPAYGWVESLKVEGGKLLAQVRDVADEFKDWVRRGLYKKVSIALYPDLGLRHVGFLGATPPAVKGLKQAAFGEKKAAWKIETDFQYMDLWQHLPAEASAKAGETVKSIFQRMRDWMIDKFSLEEADRIISPYDIEALRPPPPSPSPVATGVTPVQLREGWGEGDTNTKGGNIMYEWLTKMKEAIGLAEKQLTPDPSVKFTEADVAAKVKETEEKIRQEAEATFAEAKKQIDAEKKEKEEAQKKLREIEQAARKDSISAFCEGLCKEGKLSPALREIIEPVMVMVSGLPEASSAIQFYEGGTAVPAVEAIKNFLTEIPKVVTFKEVTPKDGPGATGSAGEKLEVLIKKKMEEKKDLSYRMAFSEVQKENPDLAKEALAEIRPKQS